MPIDSITHKSSYYVISIDYTIETFQARRILRIDLNFVNTSTSNLNQLKINTLGLKTVIAIQPQNILMEYIRPRERVCQMIYLSEFDSDNYFISCQVEFVSDGGVRKQVNIPISVDISRFMSKIKHRSNINT